MLSVFPVSRKSYWYFSCYFVLYLLIPFFNRTIHTLSRPQAKALEEKYIGDLWAVKE